ncbi:hypothetical protein ABZT02_07360 [Streptomyces sp. NPDC005402]|uniref:hypothetical protein n=1 Tax=Streptomyces sp. NPDC005402 TaxID=3155338 RepID=UPI0033A63C93
MSVSAAYDKWTTERRARLRDLDPTVLRLSGTTDERVQWSRVLMLAAEFQGFARDLHDEAGRVFVKEAARGNSLLEGVLVARVGSGRSMDRGNAHPGNLGTDFLILGIPLWDALKAQAGRETTLQLNSAAEHLNKARNAVAHSNLFEIKRMGIDADVVKDWSSRMDSLAKLMEHVVADHLVTLFGISNPWSAHG